MLSARKSTVNVRGTPSTKSTAVLTSSVAKPKKPSPGAASTVSRSSVSSRERRAVPSATRPKSQRPVRSGVNTVLATARNRPAVRLGCGRAEPHQSRHREDVAMDRLRVEAVPREVLDGDARATIVRLQARWPKGGTVPGMMQPGS